MDTKDLFKIMEEDLQSAKQDGVENIPIQNLEKWIVELKKLDEETKNSSLTQSQLEEYKTKRAGWLEDLKAHHQLTLELIKTELQLGHTALKTSILINGGAAVALLAFIGQVWNKKDSIINIQGITEPLTCFVYGVFCAGIAFGFGYISQIFYNKFKRKWGLSFHVLAFLLGLSSFIFFLLGGNSTKSLFTEIKTNSSQVQKAKPTTPPIIEKNETNLRKSS
ncbi:MAG: hypothetical protein IH886_15700 [Nitrospinae bacterium]|nr:hypothetical protein [Nitrospinota bacterium]